EFERQTERLGTAAQQRADRNAGRRSHPVKLTFSVLRSPFSVQNEEPRTENAERHVSVSTSVSSPLRRRYSTLIDDVTGSRKTTTPSPLASTSRAASATVIG